MRGLRRGSRRSEKQRPRRETIKCNLTKRNKLRYLSTLVKTVITMQLSNLNLTALPDDFFQKVPPTLKVLYCYYNQLTTLPELPTVGDRDAFFQKVPPTLKVLSCYNNQLTTLPELPPTLKKLFYVPTTNLLLFQP